ncbi:MAG: heavy-metal-associated domain-containing protein [Planctomycetaceae bacterium]|nr:heavy-metal-associated domain-containing protein [Planctomycetaceae bacterium]
MRFGALTVGLCLLAAQAIAGEVQVSDVHLCCGKCLTGATKALTGIEGVSAPRANKQTSKVTFTATNMEAAKAGVAALAKAGFYGSAKLGDEAVPAPPSGIEAGAKGDGASISGVHLCCGGCINAAEGAITSVDGVTGVTSDGKAGTMTVTGKGISLEALLSALHESGFHGSVK